MDPKRSLPAEGELVLCEVKSIQPHCAFAKLEEYDNLEGMIHISEVASSWVKNIRAHVREGKKVVCKVTRVNREKGYISLSIRRVSEADKSKKFDSIKRAKKCKRLAELCSKKLGISCDEFHRKYEELLRKEFAEEYFAFEEGARRGAAYLIERHVPDDLAKAVAEIGKASITFSKVSISGELSLSCQAGDGVERIKRVLKATKTNGAAVRYISAPKYKLSIEADDYKAAERKLKSLIETIETASSQEGCQTEFKRE